jgi:tripartite-type tricarboxylate transporter receptor subunit TctC
VAACSAFLLLSGGAAAQAYPEHLVKVIVPFSPGGGTDVMARMVSQKLGEKWGQPVIVENKTGAIGNIGARFVAQAKPDGYTILGGGSALTINPLLEDNVGYRLHEFTPVMNMATAGYLLVVNPKVNPSKTLGEFIEYAKSRNGDVAWASASEGNAEHLAGMYFQQMAGIKMRHIPYKGGADAVKDVVAGHVEAGMISVPTALQFLASGQLIALGNTDSRRAPQVPNVPTIGETLPGYELATWYSIFVPAGTPDAVVDKIHAGVFEAMKDPEVQKKVIGMGFAPQAQSRPEFAAFVKAQSEQYAKVIKASGLKK